MNKKAKLILSISSIALLLCSCEMGRGGRRTSTSDSPAPITTNTTGDTGNPSTTGTSTNTSTNTNTNTNTSGGGDQGDYYASIDPTATGDVLLNQLRTLNNTKRKKTIGYDGMRSKFILTDIDPKGSSNIIIGFYDNAEVGPAWDSGKTWNREHVWPNSRGGGSGGKSPTNPTVDQDMHMVRPTSTAINEGRGNDMYAESGAYDPACEGVPNYRGISARIIFYCLVADPYLKLTENINLNDGLSMGKLSDLLKWNLNYLPGTIDDSALELRVEQNRNNVIASDSLQGNRNPFIDHPEYACKIWGSTNSTTKQICNM